MISRGFPIGFPLRIILDNSLLENLEKMAKNTPAAGEYHDFLVRSYREFCKMEN